MTAVILSRPIARTIEAAVPWSLLVAIAIAAADRRAAVVVVASIVALYTSRGRGSSIRLVASGLIPMAVVLAWGAIRPPLAAADGSQCLDPLSPPAMWRVLEAALVLAIVAIIARRAGAGHRYLGFVRPGRGELILAAFLLAAGGIVFVGLAGPLAAQFFGPITFVVPGPLIIAPALLFAVSNAVAEEVAYRGATRAWLRPVIGTVPAIVAQAAVFGIAHSGPDFLTDPRPVMLVMFLGGLLAGFVLQRTGSLTLLIAVHAAADIPLYLYWACRVA